jgi:pimeloyl-ACP methyl ester carboxylesterase
MRSTLVDFRAGDGTRLRGVLEEPNRPPIGAVLFLHGLNETRDEDRDSRAGIPPFVQLAQELVTHSVACFRFDFRGHGESDGSSSEMSFAGETSDAMEALSQLRDHVGSRPVGIVAASFGAVAGLRLMQDGDVQVGVLWNPLLDVYGTFVAPTMPWGIATFGQGIGDRELIEFSEDFALGSALLDEMRHFQPIAPSSIEQPLLGIHGTDDTYVSIDETRRFVESCPQGEFLAIEGAGHGFGSSADREVLIPASTEWLVRHLG